MTQQFTEITKASGERVPFDEGKLKKSLERSGANAELIANIIREVRNTLYDEITTKKIYNSAFSILRKKANSIAARYKLKTAILELGPTGYPFEKFVGEILSNQGYQTDVGALVKGYCVSHEVDVIALKDDRHFMVECKFHSQQGRKCDVKIPLYIQSRFEDVKKAWQRQPGHENKFHQGWIVTNTRFTKDATTYGNCIGLNLISWDSPKRGSLKDRIESSGLHPITCLTTLKKREKQTLLEKGIVLSKQLCETPDLLNNIAISQAMHTKILEESAALCQINMPESLNQGDQKSKDAHSA